jgi:catechol 2,3-dioxygenase-like lactoylglutathione lyase family enzyme
VLSGSEDHVSQKGRVDDGKGLAVSHIGICVSDLDASLRFYCEGLGFEIVASHEVGEEFAVLMELDGVRLRSRMIRRDGVTLELLDYVIPGTIGPSERRPMNQLGLTHLSLRVADVVSVASTIESLGGTVIQATRTTFAFGEASLDFLYCTDPDGVRIELMDLGT